MAPGKNARRRERLFRDPTVHVPRATRLNSKKKRKRRDAAAAAAAQNADTTAVNQEWAGLISGDPTDLEEFSDEFIYGNKSCISGYR